MFKLIFCIYLVFITSCSTDTTKQVKSQKEREKETLVALESVRPILASDEFQFMECEEKGKEVKRSEQKVNIDFWKVFDDIDLRKEAIKKKANMMSLKYQKEGEFNIFQATYYTCKKMNSAHEVMEVGMCKASEERIFTVRFEQEFPIKIAEQIMRRRVQYYAIANYYKTYSIDKIKFSYTRNEYKAFAAFYKCL